VILPVNILEFPDYLEVKNNFTKELHEASLGNKSSLSYIKYNLPDKPLVTNGLVQGIVMGGTNYIVSLEEVSHGKTNNLSRNTGILPTLTDSGVFFDFLAKHIDRQADAIALNLGFPLLPAEGTHGEIDGILAYGTKEHSFQGLTGKAVGNEIKQFCKKHFDRVIPVAVANDTVCLALSGDGSENGAVIAGTGFNIGIKQHDEKGNVFLANLEAGNFDKFKPTSTLQEIDRMSNQPGKKLFEKTVAGKYLALYFNEKAKSLDLKIPPLTTSQELTELSRIDGTGTANELAREILKRSASLTAAAFAGIYEFLNKPENLTFIGEGSMLWYGWDYPENLYNQLSALDVPEGAIIFKKIEDSSITGAVRLVTG
jgi:hexokinase